MRVLSLVCSFTFVLLAFSGCKKDKWLSSIGGTYYLHGISSGSYPVQDSLGNIHFVSYNNDIYDTLEVRKNGNSMLSVRKYSTNQWTDLGLDKKTDSYVSYYYYVHIQAPDLRLTFINNTEDSIYYKSSATTHLGQSDKVMSGVKAQ